jgi:hypothetical protein
MECPHCRKSVQDPEPARGPSPVREGAAPPPVVRPADYAPRARPYDHDDERLRRRRFGPERGEFADCPHCGCPGHAKRVSFTWWGGIVGPSMFHHVKCEGCRRCYNGRTGADNTVGIVIYTTVSMAIGLVIVVALIALGAFR